LPDAAFTFDDDKEEEKEEMEDEEEDEVRRPVSKVPRRQRLTAGLSLPLVTRIQPQHLEGRQKEDEEEEEGEEAAAVESGEGEEEESIITDTEILAATTATRQQSPLQALRRRRAVNGDGTGSNRSDHSFGTTSTSTCTSTRMGAPTTMPSKRPPSSSLRLPHAHPVRNSRLNSHSFHSSSSFTSSNMPNPTPFPSSLYSSKLVSVRQKQRGRGRWWVLRWWPFPSVSSWDMRKWVVPQDCAFKRGWDMLTVVLATVVLCSDAASLIQQHQNPPSHPSSSSSSSPSTFLSSDNNLGDSSNPSFSSSSSSSSLDPSSLYHLLLLEAIWFLVDLALSFRTEVEIVLDDDDAAAAAIAAGHVMGRQAGGGGGGGGGAAAAAAAAAGESETETILLLRDPRAIAIQYLSRDFWLDLCLSFPWLAIAALLLTPKRKKRNAMRRALGHVGRGLGGFLGKLKNGVGSKIPRFLRPDNVKRFVVWTRLLEVKKVDGVKHVVKYRKEYRGLRMCIRGIKWLCRFPVASFIWRVHRKLEAHLVVAVEEVGGDDREEERKAKVWRAGQSRRGGMALSPSLLMVEEEWGGYKGEENRSFYGGEDGERGGGEAEG